MAHGERGTVPAPSNHSLVEIEDKVNSIIQEQDELTEKKEEKETELDELQENVSSLLLDYSSESTDPDYYEDCRCEPLEMPRFKNSSSVFALMVSPTDIDSDNDHEQPQLVTQEDSEDDDDSNSEAANERRYGPAAVYQNEVRRKKEEITEMRHRIEKTEEELQNSINPRLDQLNIDALEHIKRIMGMILTGDRRRCNGELDATPANAWEHFAAGFFHLLVTTNLRLQGINVRHCGGADDYGVDVIMEKPNKDVYAVVQVKLGKSHFNYGRGNQIILQLVGSCVVFNTKRGILFNNESKCLLSENTRKLLKRIHDGTEYKIECYFIEDIEEEINKNPRSAAEILRGFFDSRKRQSL